MATTLIYQYQHLIRTATDPPEAKIRLPTNHHCLTS